MIIPTATEIKSKLREKLSNSDWKDVLYYYLTSRGFEQTIEELRMIKQDGKFITPTIKNLFNFLTACEFKNIKAVMIVSMINNHIAINEGIPLHPRTSLYKNMKIYLKTENENKDWCRQGLLLIPQSLTAEVELSPHYELWSEFIAYLINKINEKSSTIPWVLMGKRSHSLAKIIKSSSVVKVNLGNFKNFESFHLIVNEAITMNNQVPIDW